MAKEEEFDLKTFLKYVENEYGVERDLAVSIIEEAMTKAARKNRRFTNDLRIVVGADEKLHVYDKVVVDDDSVGAGIVSSEVGKRINHGKPVQEGDILDVEYPGSVLGRVCARESRMLILQKLKTAKNFNIMSTYKDKVGDIVSGIVSGIEKGNIIFNVNGKTSMVIPRNERIQKEKYAIGDSISGVIIGVNEKQRNSPIVVSRANNRFLEELMKREVSEIADGTVEILNVCRDPGHRAKIMVKSNNSLVDPVGACVGRKGMRINNVKTALSGERLDIIRYSDSISELVKEALSPAKVEDVNIDMSDPSIVTVTVSPEEYSKAVGKFGSNVRMASTIVGKKIHVVKAVALMSFDEQKEHAVLTMSELFSISKNIAEQIVNAGYLTPEGIAEDDEASFVASTGLDEVTGKGLYAASKVIADSSSLV